MSVHESKIAIVTGGASGIGRALCERLAKGGASVTVADVNAAGAESVAASIRESGGKAVAAALDVTSWEAVSALVDETVKREGRIDLMVNNAGVAIGGLAEELTMAHWKRAVDINLMGVVHGVTAAYPVMVKQGSGHLVNVASLAGLLPVPTSTPYAATKFAVVGLTASLRAEARRTGVKVTCVCPGYIRTGIFEAADLVGADAKKYERRLKKLIIPLETATDHIMKGIERNDAFIVFPFYARLFWRLYRIHPALVRPLLDRTIADFFKVRVGARS